MKYSKYFSTKTTPQSQPIPGSDQIPNSAGGYAWGVDDWKRLDRFLILGSEKGTYYISERKLTIENAQAALRCIEEDGIRAVNRIVELSNSGRAPKNDPALFALAMATGAKNEGTRKAALTALPRVARTGTHLFHFLEYAKAFRGWGRGMRNAIGAWYNEQELNKVTYQVVKYRQRDGWTHRDALRLAHPKPTSVGHNALYQWVCQGDIPGPEYEELALVGAFEAAQVTTEEKRIIQLIQDHNLTREMIPTNFLSKPKVWKALLEEMPLWAMIRNLGNMSKVGLLVGGNWDTIDRVTSRLTDEPRVRNSRVHPISILAALNTYSRGKGFRGSGTWEVVPQVVDALDAAFYLSFGNVQPTNLSVVLALDVSGSMDWGCITECGGITPRVGSAAMALVTANVEPRHSFVGFSHELVGLKISPRQRLDDVCVYLDRIPMGGTDCALPILEATRRGVRVDLFVVYTDSETWAGNVHPKQALDEYRRKVNPHARSVVVGMVSNGFSIADPNDRGMLDVVGFDTATPNLISEFGLGFSGIRV